MSGKLSNQVAWISGAASGMGAAIAARFAREGAAVALADIQNGRALAEQMVRDGGRARFFECDVRRETDVQKSIEGAVSEFGGLHILVNCAGIVQVGTLDQLDQSEWDRVMETNVKSMFLSVKHAIRHLRKHARSYIVNIGSIGSFIAQSATPAYTASKGAVLMLSKSIALDYAADGVRCNCVCPGITDTPMLRKHLDSTPDPEATLRRRLRRVPMGVPLSPDDIARAVLYFACEDSAGITGTSLVVDCGYLAAAEWEHPGHTRFMEAP